MQKFVEANDFDLERDEWLSALDDVIAHGGRDRAERLLDALEHHAEDREVKRRPLPYSPYRNTISLEEQPAYPGDLRIEERITAILRWNALAMVMRPTRPTAIWAGTSRATHRPLKSSRWASITSSTAATRAISCTSSRIRRPASTRARSSRGA